MRVLGGCVLALAGLYVVINGLTYLRENAILSGHTEALEIPLVLVSLYQSFEETGTLVYFREGTGRVNAYLMYQVASSTRSKILNITSETACEIRALRGCPVSVAALRASVGEGPVRVLGFFRNEELYVDTLTY